MKVVVLFSGGLDSTIALYHTLARPNVSLVVPLAFYYGQRHEREVVSAREIVRHAMHKYKNKLVGLHSENVTCTIPRVGSLLNKSVSVREYDSVQQTTGVLDTSFIPHRNLFLITLAAMHARKWGAHEIVTGMRGGFSDCTVTFEKHLENLLNLSDNTHHLNLSSPVHTSRAESLRMGLSIPGCAEGIALSWTCFKGEAVPCGKCLPCLKRAEGFAEVGIPDQALAPRYSGNYAGAFTASAGAAFRELDEQEREKERGR